MLPIFDFKTMQPSSPPSKETPRDIKNPGLTPIHLQSFGGPQAETSPSGGPSGLRREVHTASQNFTGSAVVDTAKTFPSAITVDGGKGKPGGVARNVVIR